MCAPPSRDSLSRSRTRSAARRDARQLLPGVMPPSSASRKSAAQRVADRREVALELGLVPAVVLEPDQLDHAARVDHVVGRVEDAARRAGAARPPASRADCSPSPRRCGSAAAGSSPRERPADRARRVDVALGRERVGRRDDGAARCSRALLVDIGDEHVRAVGGRSAARSCPTDPAPCTSTRSSREVGRAEHVLDARSNAVQHADRRAAAAVAGGAGRSVDPRAALVHDVEVCGRDVHVARGAVRAAERRDEVAVPQEQRAARVPGRQLRHREHRLAAAALGIRDTPSSPSSPARAAWRRRVRPPGCS